ncbi:MAG: WecB/TagA/CpsF family glycosyltransferase [Rhodobacteraceae bacterium]|nr:WecB/TagA/CpsF family glycosyltransferase [Paracoccaceae bacterium]
MRSAEQLHRQVAQRLAQGRGFALATLNLDHLVKLRNDAKFAVAYSAQDLVTADGNPIVWVSKMAGTPVELLPGSDLIIPLCEIAQAEGVAIGLAGSNQASLEQAATELQKHVPGLMVASKIAPPMGFDPSSDAAAELLQSMADSGARLIFIALGAPKQELLAARGRALLPNIGFASIGAGLDFLSGQQRRAPSWVRRIAMEWLWRMMSDPRRLAKRYFFSALILPGHMLRAFWVRVAG